MGVEVGLGVGVGLDVESEVGEGVAVGVSVGSGAFTLGMNRCEGSEDIVSNIAADASIRPCPNLSS